MPSLSCFTQIVSEDPKYKWVSAIDHCFYFGGRVAEVVDSTTGRYEFRQSDYERPRSWPEIVLKIAMIATIVIPVILLSVRAFLHHKHQFHRTSSEEVLRGPEEFVFTDEQKDAIVQALHAMHGQPVSSRPECGKYTACSLKEIPHFRFYHAESIEGLYALMVKTTQRLEEADRNKVPLPRAQYLSVNDMESQVKLIAVKSTNELSLIAEIDSLLEATLRIGYLINYFPHQGYSVTSSNGTLTFQKTKPAST